MSHTLIEIEGLDAFDQHELMELLGTNVEIRNQAKTGASYGDLALTIAVVTAATPIIKLIAEWLAKRINDRPIVRIIRKEMDRETITEIFEMPSDSTGDTLKDTKGIVQRLHKACGYKMENGSEASDDKYFTR